LFGNKLEAFKRDRSGHHSIRINDQYRICFQWLGLVRPDFPSLTFNATKDFSMDTIRLLIADYHALFWEGLHALFSALPDIEVVGEAPDGATAVTQVDSSQPDVVHMDINMAGINGIEATRRIISNHPQLGIIMVTMLEDDASVFAASEQVRVAMY
jgi:CheY-like chemotaxis protein